MVLHHVGAEGAEQLIAGIVLISAQRGPWLRPPHWRRFNSPGGHMGRSNAEIGTPRLAPDVHRRLFLG